MSDIVAKTTIEFMAVRPNDGQVLKFNGRIGYLSFSGYNLPTIENSKFNGRYLELADQFRNFVWRWF